MADNCKRSLLYGIYNNKYLVSLDPVNTTIDSIVQTPLVTGEGPLQENISPEYARLW